MQNVTLRIEKKDVYQEVAKTTGYVGGKMAEDDTAYDRIATTDENAEMLDRFWSEAASAAADKLKCFSLTDRSTEEACEYRLRLASNWDAELLPSMEKSLFSFFVAFVSSKWYRMTNKGEAETAAVEALGFLSDIVGKGYYRKTPSVPDWDALEASENH